MRILLLILPFIISACQNSTDSIKLPSLRKVYSADDDNGTLDRIQRDREALDIEDNSDFLGGFVRFCKIWTFSSAGLSL